MTDGLLPPLSASEYARLKADIALRGVLVPVVYDQDGSLIDGHHRVRACTELGISDWPRVVRDVRSDAEHLALSIALNVHRRQLTPEQTRDVEGHQRELAAQLRREGRSQADVAAILNVRQQRVSEWERESTTESSNAFDLRLTIPRAAYAEIARRVDAGDCRTQIAADFKVTPQRVGQIHDLVHARERSPSPVESPAFPSGRFRAIVIDPPWPMRKIEREVHPHQSRDLDYATMSLERIEALPIRDFAEPDGCHLYLWTTQHFLPDALRIAATWGFRYECLLTWVKNVGFTPFSWMYSTEHVVFARLGSLPLVRNGLRLDFAAKRTRHSEKPEVFFDRVREASPEPRLEMFARVAQRVGFAVWGAEAGTAQSSPAVAAQRVAEEFRDSQYASAELSHVSTRSIGGDVAGVRAVAVKK